MFLAKGHAMNVSPYGDNNKMRSPILKKDFLKIEVFRRIRMGIVFIAMFLGVARSDPSHDGSVKYPQIKELHT